VFSLGALASLLFLQKPLLETRQVLADYNKQLPDISRRLATLRVGELEQSLLDALLKMLSVSANARPSSQLFSLVILQ